MAGPPRFDGTMSDDLIGRRLGDRYRVDERIGGGAMGEVYRAWDERLRKAVALKVIRAELIESDQIRQRFQNEALALAQVTHANIATIYDYHHEGVVDYLVMEYVSGVMLDQRAKAGPLSESEVVVLGLQLARGMAAAHAHGVVHRDLKPENVRLSEDGTLKILDFGIAHRLQSKADVGKPPTEQQRYVEGTPAYMSPEQWRGEKPDARSDIYSAGVLLFRIATGRAPFPDRDVNVLAYKVQQDTPSRPRTLNRAMSKELDAVILKCLEKDRQDRYVSATELHDALQRVEKAGGPDVHDRVPGWLKRVALWGVIVALGLFVGKFVDDHMIHPVPTRLAVLPFRSLGQNPEGQAFSEGLSDDLSTLIAQLNFDRLRVVGSSAAAFFRNRPIELEEIRRMLEVGYVLEGTVRSDASVVQINARLSETATGTLLWAHQFLGSLSDVMGFQRSIADSIASVLTIKSPPGRQAKEHEPDAAVYQSYLRGLFHLRQRSYSSLMRAVESFESATRIDPNYAPAYAELARTNVLLENYGYVPYADAMPAARAAAQRALELDPDLAPARVAMAVIEQDFDRKWDQAGADFRRAIELDPSAPTAHQLYASLLLVTGHGNAAMEQLEVALELDPLSLTNHAELAMCYFLTDRYGKALVQIDKALELYPNAAELHYQRGETLLSLRRRTDAREAFARAMTLDGAEREAVESMRAAFENAGVAGFWRWRLARLVGVADEGYVSAYQFARAYAALGDPDQAFAWLQASSERHESVLAGIVVDPVFTVIREDPRYLAVREALRLPMSPP